MSDGSGRNENSEEFHLHRRHDDGGLTLNERLKLMESRQTKLETLVTDLRLEMRGVLVKLWIGSVIFSAIAAGIVEMICRK